MGNDLCNCNSLNQQPESNLAPIQMFETKDYDLEMFNETKIPTMTKAIQDIYIKNRLKTIIKVYRKFRERTIQAKTITKMDESNQKGMARQEIFSNNFLSSLRNESYQGNQKKGMKEGYGKLNWGKESGNTCTVISNFQRDQIHGYGIFFNNLGVEYKGQFKNDKAYGYGIFKHPNGDNYEGYWDNTLQSGIGIGKWADGTKYRGNHCQGKKHGIGVYEWQDGAKYQGEWRNNSIHGYGIYTFKDGRVYSGQWNNEVMNGYCELTWPDGKIYLGMMKNDKRNGFGILLYKLKAKAYIGFWKNNAQHGVGKFVSKKSGNKYGKWISGSQEKTFCLEEEFFSQLSSDFNNQSKNLFLHDYNSLHMFIQIFIK